METQPTAELEIQYLGQVDYSACASQQLELVEQRQADQTSDRLLIVEHPATVTLGRSGQQSDLLFAESFYAQRKVAVHKSSRGGQLTAHEPGQLVAYPILRLMERDLHLYNHRLLETISMVLRQYGLEPQLKEGQPGIWVDGRKIASIGVAVKKWVTSHGIALNVNNDLSTFQMIVPCGHADETMTSMLEQLGRPLELAEVTERFIDAFRKVFNYPQGHDTSHPDWLRLSARQLPSYTAVEKVLNDGQLTTVCQSAHCPNQVECFNRGTATFMILGDTCTRKCRFCAVAKGEPTPLDVYEPRRLAEAAQQLKLKYVVITSVTRDDLIDGGASQFVETIQQLRQKVPAIKVEVLTPDFQGSRLALEKVFAARPDMFNHNIETVRRLYPTVRPEADYTRSLTVLKLAAEHGLMVKSGLMLGLGETLPEIHQTLQDMLIAGCKVLTLGQYLSPSKQHLPVVRYLQPEEFEVLGQVARELGFLEVASGPLVRSSYRADELVLTQRRIVNS